MSEKQTHIIYRVLKITGWFLLGVVILLLAARLALKTSWVQSIVKNKVISLANQNLNGTLTIGDFKGDLWREIKVYDLSITQNTDTLLQADTLELNYNILSLLKRSLTVHNVKLSGAHATIRETTNQGFNVQQLVKTDSTGVPPEDSSTSFGVDIEQIQIQHTGLSVYSPSYLPDSTLSIQEVEATAGFSYHNQISASLSSLSFKVKEGRLPEPVSVSTAATYAGERITLNKLAIETGRSVLDAGGFFNLADSSLNANLNMLPFSLADLQPYLQQDIPEDELTLSLSAAGSFDSLHVEMEAQTRGIEELLLIADFSITEKPVINKFGINGKNLDLAYFTNDSVDAAIGEFRISAEGRITEELADADVTWGFSLYQIRYQAYMFEILFGSGTLIQERLLANVELHDGTDAIIALAEVVDLFSEKPRWKVNTDFENINLGWWAQNPELESSLTFDVMAEGSGFSLSEKPWYFSVYKANIPRFINWERKPPFDKLPPVFVDTSVVAGQKISDIGIMGSITADTITADGFIQFIDDSVSFETKLAQYLTDEPTYTYKVELENFNLAEINAISDVTSSLNLAFGGTGKYFDPKELELDAGFLLDSSYVNGSSLEELSMNIDLRKGILKIPDGAIRSNVIEGTFSGRRNVFDQADPENNLAVEMEIKTLLPLAEYVGAEVLNAEGKITGNITDNEKDELIFTGNIDLKNIYLDETFRADRITGNTTIAIGDIYGFDTDVEVKGPVISGAELQDIRFWTKGDATRDSVSGDFSLQIKSSNSGEIVQNGFYEVNLESLKSDITWNTFNFQTPARLLSLEHPFHLSYADGAVKTDTMRLSDKKDAFLQLTVPYMDSTRQQISISGQNFNFGIIQEIIFEERFVDGILSGAVQVSRDPEELQGNGEITVHNLVYLESGIDTLRLNFHVQEERLTARLSMYIDGEEKAGGHLDVPFIAGNPDTFDDSFFEEKIEGALTIKPMVLSKFENILKEFEVANTTGIISFDGSLSGTAGEPDFEGLLNLDDPVLSGVTVDSVFAEFQYHHTQKNVTGRGEIQARGQTAASINAELPFSVDFKTFEVNMPGNADTLHFNLVTNDFNISVFNDFLDRQYLRRLKGLVNADVNITGTIDNLVPTGYFRLSDSEVTVPIAGIKLTDIKSDFSFTENGMQLNRLSAKSGSGTFNATGNIGLDGTELATLDINAKATRFRLANTSDYNLTIDMNSQLTGPITQPVASGKLTIKNGFVYLQDFGEESVETVELEEEERSSFSPYDSLAIRMEFVIERGFFIRNNRYLDMEVELTGELDAQKDSNQDLELFGTLNGEEGYARPLGKLFELDEARFTFSGPVDEPDLNIRTSYIPQSSQKEGDPIVLYYIIEGNAQNPEFRFESDPPMEQQDIICYTIFSKPCYALESWQQVVSGHGGTTPTDLLVDVLLDEVETLATQQLGIDVVQIDNTRSGSGGGTSIKTGWYINRRTFFAIVNEISGSAPETLFILEYLLSKNLDLIITQGDDNRQGIDLRWKYDY